ncbi:MAG: hypothetical protein HY926_11305 [Elusimicrobia bacterium]|nr:hypothetical protein [Elusimicrobiota bacterium]
MIKALFLASLIAAAAGPAWGAATCTPGLPASPDNTLCMAESSVNSIGGCMGNCGIKIGMQLSYTVGKLSQAMSGGGLQLWPGVVAAVRGAAIDASAAHAFPSPFMPSQGHTKITFSSLPPNVVIRIYTLSGHLVKTLSKSDPSDRLDWNPVANDQGTPLASGVYQFIVTQPGLSKKKGRLMIIK